MKCTVYLNFYFRVSAMAVETVDVRAPVNAQDPYFGQFCELCSGSELCFDTNCESNRDCANCALDIIEEVIDTTSVMEFFSGDPLNSALPDGSFVDFDPESNAMQVFLPSDHCTACDDRAVIINGTETADYQIDGQL